VAIGSVAASAAILLEAKAYYAVMFTAEGAESQ